MKHKSAKAAADNKFNCKVSKRPDRRSEIPLTGVADDNTEVLLTNKEAIEPTTHLEDLSEELLLKFIGTNIKPMRA